MRLSKARVQNYRSIRDSGWFDVEKDKTILVGTNEAGKTAIMQALQRINPPPGVPGFDPLRDFPRSAYDEYASGRIDPAKTTVVEAHFTLEEADRKLAPEGYKTCVYVFGRRLDNSFGHRLAGGPKVAIYGDLQNDLIRLCAHIDPRSPAPSAGAPETPKPSVRLSALAKGWNETTTLEGERAKALVQWLTQALPLVAEDNPAETKRHAKLENAVKIAEKRRNLLVALYKRLPVFVLFDNYYKVRPSIHLEHLAQRVDNNLLDDAQYDYGNLCLLRLLGFTARELANLGRAPEPGAGDAESLKQYRDQLDKRSYRLNAASLRLTNEIRAVWRPDAARGEADRLKVVADGQYLKVVVEDDLGVEVELDQRSEGFQWLVSFFVVFFAEAGGRHENAVLLLDEPGLLLHGMKQREFRATLSRLTESNQTIFTTHSPFLIGAEELGRVRAVEMTDRAVGTKVCAIADAKDSAALFPLREALSAELAGALFSAERSLLLENLTDYWYVETIAHLLRESGEISFDDKIAFVAAGSGAKALYYGAALNAQGAKAAVLLDSDAVGTRAQAQEQWIARFGAGRMLRTRDFYQGPVASPEVEDMLRETLLQAARLHLGWDATAAAADQPERPLCEIMAATFVDFTKYKLAKAFLRWTRNHQAANLTIGENQQWSALITAINQALK